MIFNFLILLIIPIIIVEIFNYKFNLNLLNIYQSLQKNLQIIINNISFMWSEAAGLDQTTEGGSEWFNDIIIFILIFSAFFSFIPIFISYNSDFTLIFTFSIVTVFLSCIIYIPLTFGKIITEVIAKDTPFVLIPILLLIEFVSYTFKIISLTIRITVNSSTGHALSLIFFTLACYLLEITLTYSGKIFGIVLYFICLIYMTMEIFISMLQIYVFNLLSYYYEYENL